MRRIGRTITRLSMAALLAVSVPIAAGPTPSNAAVGCAADTAADGGTMRKSWIYMEADVQWETYLRVLEPDGTYRTANRKTWEQGVAGHVSVLLCVSKRNGAWGLRLWSDGKKIAQVKAYDYLGIDDALNMTKSTGFALVPQWVTSSAIVVHPTMCEANSDLLSLVLSLPLPVSYLVGIAQWVVAGTVNGQGPHCESFPGSGGITMPVRFASNGDTSLTGISRAYTYSDDVPCRTLPASVNPPSTGTCYIVNRYGWVLTGS